MRLRNELKGFGRNPDRAYYCCGCLRRFKIKVNPSTRNNPTTYLFTIIKGENSDGM